MQRQQNEIDSHQQVEKNKETNLEQELNCLSGNDKKSSYQFQLACCYSHSDFCRLAINNSETILLASCFQSILEFRMIVINRKMKIYRKLIQSNINRLAFMNEQDSFITCEEGENMGIKQKLKLELFS